jgi:WD40 repeat protein
MPYALRAVPTRLAIFLDEIDAVRSLPFSTDELFAAIRECYNRRAEEPAFERLTFCLLGVASPTDLIRDTRMTPFNIGRRIELHDFTEEEAAPLRVGLEVGTLESPGRPEKEARALLKRILYWTGGHPYLTQRLCQAVAADRSIQNAAGVDRLCRSLFLTRIASEKDDNLIFVRERLLRSEADRAALLDLYRQVHDGRRVPDDETNPLCSLLKLSGVVTSPPFTHAARGYPPLHTWRGGVAAATGVRSLLRVRNRIYYRVFDREWVLANMPDAELRRQRAAFRRGVVRTAAVATLLLGVVSGLAGLAVYRGNVAQERLVRMVVDRGMRLADEGDYLGALPWFAEALRLDQGNPSRERLARIQFGDTLRRSPRLVQAWFHPAEVWSGAFSPDGRLLAIAGQDGVARVWDTGTGREALPPLRHAGGVNMVAFSPDGRRLLTASEDGTAQQWDAVTGARVGPPLRHLGAVYSATYSRDGRRIATASADRTARIWSAASGAPLTPPLPHGTAAVDAEFSPDGLRLATAAGDTIAHSNPGTDAEVRLWDALTGRLLAVVLPPSGGQARSARFSPDGRFLAAALAGGGVAVWDGRTGRPVSRPHSNSAWVHSAVFSPDSRLLMTAGNASTTARVWDAATGESLLPPLHHASEVVQAVFSPDGRRIATASIDTTARVWDAATGEPVTPPLPHRSPLTCVLFAPEGRRLATIDLRGTVKLWDLAGSERSLGWPDSEPWRARGWVSADGRRRIVARPDHSAQIVDSATGRPLAPPMRHRDLVNYAEFSADGRRVVTTSEDGTARVWDAASGQPVTPSLRHEAKAICASFSEDGALLITAGWDQEHLWDAVTGDAVAVPLRTNMHPLRIQFTRDGQRASVDAVGSSGTATWDLTPEPRPVGDLTRLASLLSGYRIDARVGATAVEESSEQRLWESLRSRYPREFMTSRAELDAWEYETQGAAALERLCRVGDVQAVRALQARWESSQGGRFEANLGDFFGQHGDLEGARETYGRLVAGGRGPSYQWGRCAILQLFLGDQTGYQKTCAAMLDRFGDSSDAYDRNLAAKTWDNGPNGPQAAARVLAIAERSAAASPNDRGGLTTLGETLYRVGRFEEARQRLEAATGDVGEEAAVFDWAFLAMVHHRLGHPREARAYLAKTITWMDRHRKPDGPEGKRVGLTWKQWLELSILRREAEKVVR